MNQEKASIHILDREVVQTQLDQLAASLSLNENAKFIHRPHFQLKTSSTLKIFKVQILLFKREYSYNI